jgi:hypothetical protein
MGSIFNRINSNDKQNIAIFSQNEQFMTIYVHTTIRSALIILKLCEFFFLFIRNSFILQIFTWIKCIQMLYDNALSDYSR